MVASMNLSNLPLDSVKGYYRLPPHPHNHSLSLHSHAHSNVHPHQRIHPSQHHLSHSHNQHHLMSSSPSTSIATSSSIIFTNNSASAPTFSSANPPAQSQSPSPAAALLSLSTLSAVASASNSTSASAASLSASGQTTPFASLSSSATAQLRERSLAVSHAHSHSHSLFPSSSISAASTASGNSISSTTRANSPSASASAHVLSLLHQQQGGVNGSTHSSTSDVPANTSYYYGNTVSAVSGNSVSHTTNGSDERRYFHGSPTLSMPMSVSLSAPHSSSSSSVNSKYSSSGSVDTLSPSSSSSSIASMLPPNDSPSHSYVHPVNSCVSKDHLRPNYHPASSASNGHSHSHGLSSAACSSTNSLLSALFDEHEKDEILKELTRGGHGANVSGSGSSDSPSLHSINRGRRQRRSNSPIGIGGEPILQAYGHSTSHRLSPDHFPGTFTNSPTLDGRHSPAGNGNAYSTRYFPQEVHNGVSGGVSAGGRLSYSPTSSPSTSPAPGSGSVSAAHNSSGYGSLKSKRHMKTSAQLRVLRTFYQRHSTRPNKEAVLRLSFLLGIPTTELTRWFRNERFKRKKKALKGQNESGKSKQKKSKQDRNDADKDELENSDVDQDQDGDDADETREMHNDDGSESEVEQDDLHLPRAAAKTSRDRASESAKQESNKRKRDKDSASEQLPAGASIFSALQFPTHQLPPAIPSHSNNPSDRQTCSPPVSPIQLALNSAGGAAASCEDVESCRAAKRMKESSLDLTASLPANQTQTLAPANSNCSASSMSVSNAGVGGAASAGAGVGLSLSDPCLVDWLVSLFHAQPLLFQSVSQRIHQQNAHLPAQPVAQVLAQANDEVHTVATVRLPLASEKAADPMVLVNSNSATENNSARSSA